jgi:hypothetical protein
MPLEPLGKGVQPVAGSDPDFDEGVVGAKKLKNFLFIRLLDSDSEFPAQARQCEGFIARLEGVSCGCGVVAGQPYDRISGVWAISCLPARLKVQTFNSVLMEVRLSDSGHTDKDLKEFRSGRLSPAALQLLKLATPDIKQEPVHLRLVNRGVITHAVWPTGAALTKGHRRGDAQKLTDGSGPKGVPVNRDLVTVDRHSQNGGGQTGYLGYAGLCKANGLISQLDQRATNQDGFLGALVSSWKADVRDKVGGAIFQWKLRGNDQAESIDADRAVSLEKGSGLLRSAEGDPAGMRSHLIKAQLAERRAIGSGKSSSRKLEAARWS